MDAETKYKYQKRVAQLEREVSDLRRYKDVALNVFDHIVDCVRDNSTPQKNWILRQFKDVMK